MQQGHRAQQAWRGPPPYEEEPAHDNDDRAMDSMLACVRASEPYHITMLLDSGRKRCATGVYNAEEIRHFVKARPFLLRGG
jgi:hypothetical protein